MAKAKAPEEKPPTADDAVEIETMKGVCWIKTLDADKNGFFTVCEPGRNADVKVGKDRMEAWTIFRRTVEKLSYVYFEKPWSVKADKDGITITSKKRGTQTLEEGYYKIAIEKKDKHWVVTDFYRYRLGGK